MKRRAQKPVSLPPVGIRSASEAKIIALRESSIISLARVDALDADQIEAAFRFRNLYEEYQALHHHESNKFERIDQIGFVSDPAPQRRHEAERKLKRCRQLLGQYGFAFVVKICAEGYSLVDLYSTRRERDTHADLLRVHLSQLAPLLNDDPTAH